MIIKLKNKDTLIIDDFKLKCCIGKGGLKKNKIEGDGTTPKGKFSLGNLYWRSDKVEKPITNLKCKKIKKNIGWCTDSKSKFYNNEFKIKKNIKHEKLLRKDYKYNYLIVINYNRKNVNKLVTEYTYYAIENNLDGIICSPQEINIVKKIQ